MQSALLLLKNKYSLAHIPSRHKAMRWVSETEGLVRSGYSAEEAGIEAAKRLFPYEYKETAVYQAKKAEVILSLLTEKHE